MSDELLLSDPELRNGTTLPGADIPNHAIMRMVLSAVPYFLLCMVFWVFIRLAWRCFTYPMEQRNIIRKEKQEEEKKKKK
ncbi:hypothetical protein E2C01_029101 [Portunus trituberculatus]|uniref:Uncharacterized protein n=1 Tax=Portunus trituberculatus TaxID=210409 RepID=A0A5B7ENA1_PORTR|nr:hypothetical protein [Portunus trituberculatus]